MKLSTNRSYNYWINRLESSGKTAHEFLSTLSFQSFMVAKASFVSKGIAVNDCVTRATRQGRFIDVPSPDQAKRIVESVPGRAGLALRLIHGTAMRLTDCLRLRVEDLDFQQQRIKLRKDRAVAIPTSLLKDLAEIVNGAPPHQFLFASDNYVLNEGVFYKPHIQDQTLHSALKKARLKLRFKRHYTVEAIRRSGKRGVPKVPCPI